MSNQISSDFRVEGTVAPGFESVKSLYEHEMRHMAEENAQLCVYYRGERVVDLWASVVGDKDFSPDSLVNVFSSGKSLETIAMASLVGKGLLDYKAKVVDYWPEFGAHGKSELTVADLLRHEGGMAAFDTTIDPENLLPENIKRNRVGAIVEEQTAKFRAGDRSRREYHAITRGWILNELFRRVDPAGRTIGEYLREDITAPLGADAYIGVPEKELSRISRVKSLGFGFQFIESLKPRFMGRRITHGIVQILGRILKVLPSMRHATTRGAPPPCKGMKGLDFFNETIVARGETPSAGAKCSARGLAKIAAMMSEGGTWEGQEYLGAEAWKAMHGDPIEAEMGFGTTNFSQGGVNLFTKVGPQGTRLARDFNTGREGFVGWMGLGGSIFQWNPEQQIGFAFVPTALHVIDILNERAKVYQAEVLRCVSKLEK
jgi:CubicO group peptidase (beta-lactamase class C family)